MSLETANRTTAQLLAKVPTTAQQVRSQAGNNLGLVDQNGLRSLALAAMRGLTRVLSGLAFSAATAGTSTIAIYRVKNTAGGLLVDGHSSIEGAVDPLVLIGSGKNIDDAIDLDGEDAVVLAAAGKSYHCAIVAAYIDGAVKLVAVFGAAANTGAQAALTYGQIRAALTAKYGEDWDGANGFVIGKVLFQRQKVITYVAGGSVANGGTFKITINGTGYTYTATVPTDDAAAVGAGLRALIGTNEAGVAVSGAGANVILTGAAGTTFTSSSEASGAGTLVGTQADTMTQTITDPDSNAALLQERSAGSLWDNAS